MNEKICVWANGSTNPITKKNELPELCKRRNCKGRFDSMKDMIDFCEVAQPVQSLESVKKFVNRYDYPRDNILTSEDGKKLTTSFMELEEPTNGENK